VFLKADASVPESVDQGLLEFPFGGYFNRVPVKGPRVKDAEVAVRVVRASPRSYLPREFERRYIGP
jgi:hypothetical protein